jgi:hypothetical protein
MGEFIDATSLACFSPSTSLLKCTEAGLGDQKKGKNRLKNTDVVFFSSTKKSIRNRYMD